MADLLPCPSCGAPLTGAPACDSCALPLTGPAAQQLWQVDQQLLAVDAQRARLLAERARLLAVLRAAPEPGTAGSLAAVPARVPAPPTAPPVFPGIVAVPQVGPAEWTPQRVQNLLLGLGALLLAVAATVFAAVTYDRLGAGGRAAVLVGLTVAALAAVPVLLRRGLTASAETATGVALVLAALDAYGLRTLGLGDGLEPTTYAAAAAAVLAAGSAAWASAFPLRLPRVAAIAVAQLPPVLLLWGAGDHGASAGTAGLVLAGLAAADVALAHVLRDRPLRDAATTAVACAAVVGGSALVLSLGAAVAGQERGAGGLLACAALCALAALAVRDAAARSLLSGAVVPLLGIAAWALARPELTAPQEPLVAAAVGLLAAQLAALLPRDWRTGPVVGALAVTAAGVLVEAQALTEAVLGPVGWLVDPWQVDASVAARDVVAPALAWSGTVVTLVVLVAAAVTAVTAAAALHRLEQGLAPAAVLVVASAVLLPLGLATSLATALVLLVLVATALAGGAVALARTRERPAVELALLGAAAATALLAACWSTASEGATALALPVLALLLAAVSAAARPREAAVAAAGAGLLAGAALAAHGAARGLTAPQVGGLLLVAPAVLLGLSLVTRRAALEVAAAVLGATAVVVAVTDPGWLSWCLAGTGLLALALALRPDRRWAAPLGALLLAASSWVRLADAGVVSPEPYVVPLGLVALGLGHLRRRAEPATGSMAAYSPGLGLLLLPSLLYALGDEQLLRSVLLLGAAAAVLVAGVAGRLRAPLLFGGGVLAVDAVHLLAPYAAALPRWVPLAALGLGLVSLGATYERRRQDLSALRDRLDALA